VRHLLNVNQLEPLFDAIVVSSEVRSAKPDREIYEIALRKLSSAPSESVMVDDNPDNIEGAARAGMSGLVFSTNEKLATDLGL
jgi:putative hydrolase of the HAD superfamily